ncbi:MAG: ParA family protein [Thiobacillaceae bacterium]|nr:ParA family protein [Thiobacillaceae bacterium]
MAVIAVFNQKGGVGKTTTVLNLAAALALFEREPLVLDLDPQGHVSLALGVRALASEASLAAFYRAHRPLGTLLRRMPNGVRLIPAHPDLSKVDALLGSTPGVAGRLRQGLRESGLDTGVVLIDCAPALGVLSLNALFAADRVLVPVTADFLTLQGLSRLDIALKVLEPALGRSVERRVVLTRYDEARPQCREALARLRQRYGAAVCETCIPDDAALAESPAHGQDIFAHAGDSRGAYAYQRLATELMDKGFLR